MALLDDLKSQVARNTDVAQSAVTLINGLRQKLAEAGTDATKLQELKDELGRADDALGAAVAANTVAAPAGAPAETGTGAAEGAAAGAAAPTPP